MQDVSSRKELPQSRRTPPSTMRRPLRSSRPVASSQPSLKAHGSKVARQMAAAKSPDAPARRSAGMPEIGWMAASRRNSFLLVHSDRLAQSASTQSQPRRTESNSKRAPKLATAGSLKVVQTRFMLGKAQPIMAVDGFEAPEMAIPEGKKRANKTLHPTSDPPWRRKPTLASRRCHAPCFCALRAWQGSRQRLG